MAVIQISKIQHRRGLRIDVPGPLNDAEFGWAEDTKELFIGNGPFHDGNTQLLTELSPATIPPYTYISNTDSVAKTGVNPFGDPSFPDPNFDTVRSYQEKFDDIVNVKDYGAVGDFDFSNPGGLSDDTGALLRAMRDIYDEVNGGDPRRRKAIFFPAGVYRITQALPLYPFSRIVGDGKGRTVIFLDRNLLLDPNITFLTGNDCVARTVDSLGNSGLNLSGSSAILSPQNVQVFGVTFRSNVQPDEPGGPVSNNGSVKEIVKLDQAKNVRFESVEFRGNWNVGNDFTTTVIDGSVGVLMSRIGDLSVDMKNYSFKGCEFRNTAYAFNVLDSIENVLVHDSTFEQHYRAIKLGFDSAVDLTLGTGGNPRLFRASHCRFGGETPNIEDIAFDVRDPVITTTQLGNISTYNHYTNNNVTPAVRFDEGTRACVSIGDTFDNTSSSIDCVDILVNLRVQNHSLLNVVMNAQDRFQIPNGFCGTIIIDGDLTVLGDLTINGAIINSSLPFDLELFSTTLITTVPFSAGNVIFFEYGFSVAKVGPGSYHRVGVMRIIHDEEETAPGIDFADTYNELNGPPDDAISLEAVIVGTDVLIQVITVGTNPTFNFNTRILDTI